MAGAKKQSGGPPQPRGGMLDLGWVAGQEFCYSLLDSGDVLKTTLQEFLPSERGTKAQLATVAAERIVGGANADVLALAVCKRPRMWMAFRLLPSPPLSFPTLGTATELLTGQRRDGWFGPWVDNDGSERVWYVHVQRVLHFLPGDGDGEKRQRVPILWQAVAEVGPDYVALHWNGFQYNETRDTQHGNQFEYWDHVPRVFVELDKHLGASSVAPNVGHVVLEKLLPTLSVDPTLSWVHQRIRAEREGVVLNAKGAKVKSLKMKGLENLSSALAKSAVTALDLKGPPNDVQHWTKIVNAGLLRTLITEWGTKSYEFSIDRSGEPVFHAHCFFGSHQGEPAAGQDAFPHFMCYAAYGSSRGALDFILPHCRP